MASSHTKVLASSPTHFHDTYSAGSKDHASTHAGHDPLGNSVSHNNESDMGILVGGGQPSHYGQIRSSSWTKKGDREPIKCWNNIFSAPIRTNPKLDFYAPACVDGVPEIHPPDEAVFEGVSMWKGCLVGQFFDRILPIHVVRVMVDKLWGKHDAGASINTPNIGNSALIIEELDWGGQDALNTCENSFFGPHLGLGRQKNVIRLRQTPDVFRRG